MLKTLVVAICTTAALWDSVPTQNGLNQGHVPRTVHHVEACTSLAFSWVGWISHARALTVKLSLQLAAHINQPMSSDALIILFLFP